MEPLNYRYPGGKPFESYQSHLFFGRANDVARLHARMELEKCIVLFSRSGTGKTSLINAGLIPYFYEKYGSHCDVVKIRFNSTERNTLSPVNTFVNHTIVEDTILDQIPVLNTSIWQAMKSRQFKDGFDNKKQYLVILDQFEEIFNYDEEEIKEFKHQLANLYNDKVPNDFQKTIKREVLINQSLQEMYYQTDLEDKLQSKIPIKILISIRSDKLSLLNQFKDCFPELLLNCYELAPLDINQAREAIVIPAQLEGTFVTGKFEFSSKALQTILDFLSLQSKRWVESFQLQIICQYIEEEIVRQQNEVCIESYHIADNLKQIIREYYEKELRHITQEGEYNRVKKFIEEKFILKREKRRVSIDQGTIETELGVELANKLFTSKLLRSEPNNQEGISYELSHDSLIEPILISKTQRETEEAKEKLKFEQRKRYKKILIGATTIVSVVIVGAYIYIAYTYKVNSANEVIRSMQEKLLNFQSNTERESQKRFEDNIQLIKSSVNEKSTLSMKIDSLESAHRKTMEENTRRFLEQKRQLDEFITKNKIYQETDASNKTERSQLEGRIQNLEQEKNNQKLDYENKLQAYKQLIGEMRNNMQELGKKIDSTKYLNSKLYPNDAYVKRISVWYKKVEEPLKKLENKIGQRN